MKRSDYTDYDQLPLFLNAEMAAKLLGISLSSAYELMHEEGFPALRIGNRIVVPKEMPHPPQPAEGQVHRRRDEDQSGNAYHHPAAQRDGNPAAAKSGCHQPMDIP